MSIGITEILLILTVIVILFGGKRIPELARAIGRASYEYKKAKHFISQEAQNLKETIENEAEKPQAYEPKDL